MFPESILPKGVFQPAVQGSSVFCMFHKIHDELRSVQDGLAVKVLQLIDYRPAGGVSLLPDHHILHRVGQTAALHKAAGDETQPMA